MTVEGFCLKDCQRVNSDVTVFYRQPPFRNLTAEQGLDVSVPQQKLRVFSRKRVRLGNLGRKSPPHQPPSPPPPLLKQLCETGNVYAPDPEKECFRSYCARILSSEVLIDCVLNRYSVYGFAMCHRADLLCARKFYFLFLSGVCRLLTGKYRHRFKILTVPFLLKLNTLNDVINNNDPPVIQ